MRSNDHSRERRGVWDTSRLGPGPVRDLVEGDKGAANWLAKLGVARALLVDAAPRMRPETDALAAAFVYLSWVNSGAIPCAEGGGHHRPNHHARTAQAIFRSLEWAIEEDRPRGPREAAAPRLRTLLARRLQGRLPSFDAAFTQSVPLTRIRDIAHRGDIPHVREPRGGLHGQGRAGVWGPRTAQGAGVQRVCCKPACCLLVAVAAPHRRLLTPPCGAAAAPSPSPHPSRS